MPVVAFHCFDFAISKNSVADPLISISKRFYRVAVVPLLIRSFSLSLLIPLNSWFNHQRSHHNFLLDSDRKAHGIFNLTFFEQNHCTTSPHFYALLLLLSPPCPCASLTCVWAPASLPKTTLRDLSHVWICQSLGLLLKYRKTLSRSPPLVSKRRVEVAYPY